MAASRTALIVGAGIGGLAAAVALRRFGWDVQIFERASSPRELGFALNLAPNAMAALKELGLDGPVREGGHVVGSAELRQLNGRVLRRVDLADTPAVGGAPSVVALRPVVHGALLGAVPESAITCEADAGTFRIAGNRVTLWMRDGRTAEGDLLVAADGVRSIIRKRMRPKEGGPRKSGFWAVRGVAYGATSELGLLSAAVYVGRGLEGATVKAGEHAVYWYFSLPESEVIAGAHVTEVIVDRCAARVAAPFQAILRATRSEDMRLDELFDREPIKRWGMGPVTLLGDAAHPMLPHTGQGAAQAIEDAVALGLAVTKYSDVSAALRQYERVRSARTAKIVKAGRRIVRMSTSDSALVNTLRDISIRFLPTSLLLKGAYLGGTADPHAELRGTG